MLRTHVDPEKIGVWIFKSLVIEGYLELSNGTGTTEKLCVCTFSFYKRFQLFRPLDNTFCRKYV